MSVKTAAELQLEYLKKLKEQMEKGSPRPRAARRDESATAPLPSQAMSLSAAKLPKKKKTMPSLPLSVAAWKRLREEGFKKGQLKRGRELGDWAVELLLSIPYGLKDLSEESRAELFAKIRDWSNPRGLG
jgi:hypothetical protein